ncbi:peptide chain release factor 2 [Alkalibacter mobilis]|uniref:peptide chain release factor 2 n=1 Tax=Alkalibacter mobilis TaxID=2787712 RepID=UPI00189E9A29|nr:peptide chain release factor 2 [Alkalibacter mobilis]
MLELQEYNKQTAELKENLKEIGDSLDLSKLEKEVEELSEKVNDENFWNDQERAQSILKKLNFIKNKLSRHADFNEKVEHCETLIEMLGEGPDGELEKELVESVKTLSKELEEYNLEVLLSGEYDGNSAVLSLHPGAGGTESQDWAQLLLRMYTRWAEKKKYKVRILELQPGDEAGIKSAALAIEGPNAYGFLKSEKGVHRLVRISPFDSSGRRHTSFASVDIAPEIDDDVEIDINQEDLRIDTYRASGAGGQHVNTTDSAIRITHIPTGIVVQCQNERSQHKNKDMAMKMLYGKLVELKEREHKEKIEDLQGEYGQIAWGNQIRSYVFHPYNMVKDHRTGVEIGNIQSVMDGEIDPFINEYLKNLSLGGN